MILGALLLAVSMQLPSAATPEPPTYGDEQLKLGEAAPDGSPEQRLLFDNAAREFRRVEGDSAIASVKAAALEKLAVLYDSRHLRDAAQVEMILRELSTLAPDDLTLLFRLSRVQEEQQELDAAETTLLYARHAQPAEIEPYRMLAEFYSRRVGAVAPASPRSDAPAAPSAPSGPDGDGFYHVGGSIQSPRRLDIPQFPPEAQGSGIAGVVTIEVSLNEAGELTNARVLRSVPLLDDAALDAVRHWTYEPTMVDGRPVPVKLTVTVSFTLRQ